MNIVVALFLAVGALGACALGAEPAPPKRAAAGEAPKPNLWSRWTLWAATARFVRPGMTVREMKILLPPAQEGQPANTVTEWQFGDCSYYAYPLDGEFGVAVTGRQRGREKNVDNVELTALPLVGSLEELGLAPPAAAKPGARTAEILKELKQKLEFLLVEIDLSPEDKDSTAIKLRSVVLASGKMFRFLRQRGHEHQDVMPDGSPASAVAGLSADQAEKLAETLAKSDFFELAAKHHSRDFTRDKVIPPPAGSTPYPPFPDAPNWRITIRMSGYHFFTYVTLSSDWKIGVSPFLRALRGPLDGDAGKALDALLAQLEDPHNEPKDAAAVALAKEPGWSEAAGGVRARLRLGKPQWKPGETPSLEVDLWNQSRRKLLFREGEGDGRFELDGFWNHASVWFSGWRDEYRLSPGALQKSIPRSLSLGYGWRSEKGEIPLRWEPGKHRLRLALSVEGMTPGENRLAEIVTNPVEFEILPSPPLPKLPDPNSPLHPNYRFILLSPDWRVEESYLKRVSHDTFLSVKPAERDPDFKGYFRELDYFRADEKQPCVILRFYPSGEIADELDRIGWDGAFKGEGHDRSFDRDGTLRCYQFWKDGRYIEGVSVREDGTLDRLTNSHGILRLPVAAEPKTHLRTCYHDGHELTDVRVVGGVPVETRLNAGDEFLIVNAQEERLFGRDEVWTKPANGPAGVQKMGETPVEDWRRPRPEDIERRRREDDLRYAAVRRGFLSRFKEQADASGFTLSELGVAALFAAGAGAEPPPR